MATSVDPQALAQAIELLKQAKPLLDSGDGVLLAVIGTLGAIGGALAAFFPAFWNAKLHERQLKESVAVQLYAEIQAILEIERYRGYTKGVREIIEQFDQGKISRWSFQVQVSSERFLVYKANLPNLGRLPPRLQQKIVLLYQTMESVVQDMQPGGYLNSPEVSRHGFSEVLELLVKARRTGEEVLAEIEALYPGVR